MTIHTQLRTATTVGAAVSAILLSSLAQADTTLSGWALMPANTFAPGPSSGQFATSAFAASNPLPLVDKQPVQGTSGVLHGPTANSFYVMTDNGFGAKTNSADALLRMYAVTPNFKSYDGSAVVGAGTVDAVDYQSGAAQTSFNTSSFITLRDPDHKLGFQIVAEQVNYPNGANNIAVDQSIRDARLLTGADFDIEAVRQDQHGNLWFGDEFGPFLIKTDASGKVLRSEIALPGVQSPQNPHLVGAANLGRSSGFEGMAINPAGDKLFTLLEGTVSGDAPKSLRINEFDIASETYGELSYLYQLESAGTDIGDMTAVNTRPVQPFHAAVEMLDDGAATLDPVATVHIAHPDQRLVGSDAHVTADYAIKALFGGVTRDRQFVVAHIHHRALEITFHRADQ